MRNAALLASTVLSALLFHAREANAQACCVAPGAAGVARLASYETFLAGVDTRAQAGFGSFDSGGRFQLAPAGSRDVLLQQEVFASARFFSRGQASLGVPFVETVRRSSTAASSGAGLGDVRGTLRWDALYGNEKEDAPGVAILAGVVAPTGRAPEAATDRLGAEATGTGTTQLLTGVALEKDWGPWLALAATNVTFRMPREVDGVSSSLSPRASATLLGAYALRSGFAASLSAMYAIEGRATVNGEVVAGSHRRLLTATFAFQAPLGGDFRLIGSVFAQPPIPAINAGEPAALGASLALVRPWS